MAKSCTVCGEDIDAENEPYVTANRRVYHLNHENEKSIKTEEYEKIISTLREGFSLQKLSIDKKNELFLEKQELIDKTLEENSKHIEDLEELKNELQSVNDHRARMQEEIDQLTAEVDDYHKLQADLKEQLENGKDDTKESDIS